MNIISGIKSSKKSIRFRAIPFIFCLLFLVSGLLSPCVYAVPALPPSGVSALPFGESVMSPAVGSDGSYLDINVDSPDSDVYWTEFANGTRRAWNWLRSKFEDDVCPKCPDTTGRHHFIASFTEVQGVTGNFYICEHCGKSAGEVLEDAYDNYVSDMPVNGYTSDGGFLWYPSTADLKPISDYEMLVLVVINMRVLI